MGTQVAAYQPTRIIRNSPSQVVMIGSTRGNTQLWGYTSYYYQQLLFPHPGQSANIGFADGHVKNVGNTDSLLDQLAAQSMTFVIVR